MSTSPASTSPRELSTFTDEEIEPLLETFGPPPVNKKVESCKEALYSGLVGGAWGLATGLALSGLFYANSGKVECVPIGAVASTVASVAGAAIGTITKNGLKSRSIRALAGAFGTSATALTLSNATAIGMSKAIPVWAQFAIGIPAALAGAAICGCTKERMARLLSGFVTTAGSGALLGFGLSTALSAAIPQVGTKTGALLGLMGIQGICGYIMATDKFHPKPHQ